MKNYLKDLYSAYLETDADAINGLCKVEFNIDDYSFFGSAQTHPDDMKYFSPLVGWTIATHRAHLQALQFFILQAKREYNAMRDMYMQGIKYDRRNAKKYDPENSFYNAYDKAAKLLDLYRKVYKAEKHELSLYINSLKEFNHYMDKKELDKNKQ